MFGIFGTQEYPVEKVQAKPEMKNIKVMDEVENGNI